MEMVLQWWWHKEWHIVCYIFIDMKDDISSSNSPNGYSGSLNGANYEVAAVIYVLLDEWYGVKNPHLPATIFFINEFNWNYAHDMPEKMY